MRVRCTGGCQVEGQVGRVLVLGVGPKSVSGKVRLA
jgi:hypothetical protein